MLSTVASTRKRLSSEVAARPRAAQDVQWTKCPVCEAFIYHKRLKRTLGVCPECNHHFRLPVRERLALLLDADSLEELSGNVESIDALVFADTKPYSKRLEEAQRKTGNR